MKKVKSLALLSFVFVLSFMSYPVLAVAIETEDNTSVTEVQGEILVSSLPDNGAVYLTGDTIITLDVDKKISTISIDESTRAKIRESGNRISLTVKGTASLYAQAIYLRAEDGIYGSFILESGIVNLSGTGMSYGTLNGGVYINGGELNISSTDVFEMGSEAYFISNCYGIAGGLTVTGGKVTVRGKWYGVCADEVNVNGGIVDIEGLDSGLVGYMGWAGPFTSNLTVTNGLVKVSGKNVGASLNELTVSGGTLIARSESRAVGCWGAPPELGDSIVILSPANAYIPTERTEANGYSILNADGTPAKEVIITASAESQNNVAPSAWATAEVTAAINTGLVPANLQQAYTAPVSRADVAQMFVNLLEQSSGKTIDELLAEKGLSINPDAFTDTNDPAVLAVNALGIINGIGDDKFDPAGTLTRSQIAAIINREARVLGIDTSGYVHSFTDVSGHWVDAELGWPVHAGIINGVGDNRFDPDSPLTTEQAIAITYRALCYFLQIE